MGLDLCGRAKERKGAHHGLTQIVVFNQHYQFEESEAFEDENLLIEGHEVVRASRARSSPPWPFPNDMSSPYSDFANSIAFLTIFLALEEFQVDCQENFTMYGAQWL